MAITLKDRLIEMAVLGVSAGGTGAAFGWFLRFGFKEDDVFAFFGALVGAAATVAGAAWLADRSAAKERSAEHELIISELIIIEDIAECTLDKFPNGSKWANNWRSGVDAMVDITAGASDFFEEVKGHAKTLDFSERESLKSVRGSLKNFHDFYNAAIEDNIHAQDDRTWASEIRRVLDCSRTALSSLRK